MCTECSLPKANEKSGESHNRSSCERQNGATTTQPITKKPKNASVLAMPSTRDQSTSTATLHSLLHTERPNDDMDNKISECISKLRQVSSTCDDCCSHPASGDPSV